MNIIPPLFFTDLQQGGGVIFKGTPVIFSYYEALQCYRCLRSPLVSQDIRSWDGCSNIPRFVIWMVLGQRYPKSPTVGYKSYNASLHVMWVMSLAYSRGLENCVVPLQCAGAVPIAVCHHGYALKSQRHPTARCATCPLDVRVVALFYHRVYVS